MKSVLSKEIHLCNITGHHINTSGGLLFRKATLIRFDARIQAFEKWQKCTVVPLNLYNCVVGSTPNKGTSYMNIKWFPVACFCIYSMKEVSCKFQLPSSIEVSAWVMANAQQIARLGDTWRMGQSVRSNGAGNLWNHTTKPW